MKVKCAVSASGTVLRRSYRAQKLLQGAALRSVKVAVELVVDYGEKFISWKVEDAR